MDNPHPSILFKGLTINKLMSKICNGCKINKDITFYYKDTKLKSGYRGKCKDCTKKCIMKYENKPFISEENRNCSICTLNKSINEFYKNIKSKNGYFSYCKTCHNNKRNDNLENIDKNKLKQRKKKYLILNRNKINSNNKERYKNDINFRIKQCLRARLRHVINSSVKKSSSLLLLDCDLLFFKKWIEYQFEEWMSWDNYGKWQFDHVIPCSYYDLNNINNQNECFNWKNYQPLQKEKNLSKNNKFDKNIINTHKIKIEKFVNSLKPKGDEGSTTR